MTFKSKKFKIIMGVLISLIVLTLVIGISSDDDSSEIESTKVSLEVITDNWYERNETFGGYDLLLGNFSEDNVASIGHSGNIVLSFSGNEKDIRNYTTIVRNGYAENNIEELAIILGIMITAPLQENPSLTLSDIENLKDYVETETDFDAQGHQIRFSGDKSDTFYMHVYINSRD